MKHIFIIVCGIITIISCNQPTKHDIKINKYVDFLENNNNTAKDYILDLFVNNDLVILCERDHRENTQYDFLKELISDSRFIKNVGNIFFETGMRNLNPELNDFVHSENLSEKEVEEKLIELQRKSDCFPLWEMYNFYYQNKEIYTINQSLPNHEKINIYPVDVAVNLDSLSVDYLEDFWNGDSDNRDKLMAEYIIEKFEKIKNSNAKRKKALVIMNYRHAYNKNFQMSNKEMIYNVGAFLFEKYPNKTANVLINSVIIQGGKWDASFKVANNEDSGFDFKNSPFGEDHFDMWSFTKHDDKYQDMFTGFIYYKKPEDFKLITGVEGLIDTTFIQTYKNRVKLWQQVSEREHLLDDDEIYKEYGTKNIRPLENIDSISSLINRWIIK
ncbi:hypothetical protein [Flavivirga rizhaonensis]|uniref:Uncharacterized protein n=1 Tax=Flavivirga rizhaonensis TaxID=2559571 RepID=A0A4S1E175_9FLAO|nr:hypothetical protein [Flavivirga rizhaonensis]TGV04346.1 hypothetical protein EM932_02165 [Flavivirga rizhaonensis]